MSPHSKPDSDPNVGPAEPATTANDAFHGDPAGEGDDAPDQRLVQSLQLHQLELAQQNESLEQARLDLAASLSEAELRYDEAPVGLVTVNCHGLVQRVNRRAREMLELTHDAPLAQAMLNRLESVSRDVLWRMVRAPQPSRREAPTELVIVLASGEDRVLHAELAERSDHDGHLMMSLVDVTERRRAELALDHTRHILELSNRVARIGHWTFECATDRLEWSGVVREIHELPADYAPTPQAALGFYSEGNHRDRVTAALNDARTRGEPIDLDVSIVTATGHERWVRLIALAQFADGQCQRLYGTLQDIDARIQAERARLALAQAHAHMRSKSEFMARVSHDLRTPLNALIAFTQLLQRDKAVAASPTAGRQLEMMSVAGKHLLALIDDVLDFASIDSGGLRLQLETLPLASLLREAVDLVAPEGRAQRVSVQLDGSAALCPHRVRADARRLRQVLVNILGNGVKFNRPGGTVVLSVQPTRDDDDHVVIDVSDTGAGMAPEVLPLLFQPFTRVAAPGQPAVEGTGLGLAISRQLLEAMGGSVTVRSTLAVGSVFSVILPLVDGGRPAQGRPYRVLCVEDSPVNAEVIRYALEGCAQLSLSFAATGMAALSAVRQQRPDLILMDLGLPDLDGMQVHARLQADPMTAQIPCVVVSANAEPATIAAALAAGFVHYLLKPVTLDELVAVVERLRPTEARPSPPPQGTAQGNAQDTA